MSLIFNPSHNSVEDMRKDASPQILDKEASIRGDCVIGVTGVMSAEQGNNPGLLGSWRDLPPQ